MILVNIIASGFWLGLVQFHTTSEYKVPLPAIGSQKKKQACRAHLADGKDKPDQEPKQSQPEIKKQASPGTPAKGVPKSSTKDAVVERQNGRDRLKKTEAKGPAPEAKNAQRAPGTAAPQAAEQKATSKNS